MGNPVRSVRFVNAAQRAMAVPAAGGDGDLADGWEPLTWLGAPAPGGLALPAAHPTASWLYAPRGVHLGRGSDGERMLVVADTGNHRVLIWHTLPEHDEQPCDLVLGQPDPTTEGPAAGGRGPRCGMYLPTGVLVHQGMLVVADAWHHRILIYGRVPRHPDTEPDLVLGQADPEQVDPNRGGQEARADSLYWPFGIALVDGRFWVADTGNRRVLGWSGGVPTDPAVAPDVVLGQPDSRARQENRGGQPGPASFRWPHDLAGHGDTLLVADAGNHRVLGWAPAPQQDVPADLVLGQPSLTSAEEWPYGPQRAEGMRFPYAVDVDTCAGSTRTAVADTANNRVLIWDGLPRPGADGVGPAPTALLGQPDAGSNGENRWSGVTRDSLCWPYGLSLDGDLLAIADSGNNRVVLWRRAER